MEPVTILLIVLGVIIVVLCVIVVILGVRPYLHRYDKLREFCYNTGIIVDGKTVFALLTEVQDYVKKIYSQKTEQFCVDEHIVTR